MNIEHPESEETLYNIRENTDSTDESFTNTTENGSDKDPPQSQDSQHIIHASQDTTAEETASSSHSSRKKSQKRHATQYISRKSLKANRKKEKKTHRRFWFILLSLAGITLFLFLTFLGTGAYITYHIYEDTLHHNHGNAATLRDLIPPDNMKIYDSHGVLVDQLVDNGLHTYVPLAKISPDLVRITVSTEDKDFWTNSGIDIPRLLRSALEDLQQGQVVSGGSTITQQLIKNLIVGNQENTTHLLNNGNVIRKLQEIMLTPQIDISYSKADIIEMYLNSIYYGEQAYGIDAAAGVYFGLQDQPNRPASAQLDLAQSAMLAGIPSSPTLHDPLQNPTIALQHLTNILQLAVRNNVITQDQANAALNEAERPDFLHPGIVTKNRAPHFVQLVLTQIEHMYHRTRPELSRSGINVSTTLDITLQDQVQQIAQEHISAIRDENNITNAAEVIINFHTGAILTLLGSLDYNDKAIDGQFDVATDGYRQPGSSFKPYVYATAFAQGYSPGQAIDDAPLNIPLSNGQVYAPQNYDNAFHGHMTLRCALQNSLNIPAVKTLQHVGINSALQTAEDMGLGTYEGTPGLSMVLGGLSVTLLNHTSAYGTFANGGIHVPYYTINKITFAGEHKTYQHQIAQGTREISPQVAYMTTNVLSDNTARYQEFGSCSPLYLYNGSEQDCYAGVAQIRPAAAKTGTTDAFRDNWTMGYTSDFVMGVWAGNNDYTPMINDITGVKGAAPIWHDSMLVAEEGHPIQQFQEPSGLIQARVTYPDNVQSNDLYLAGHIPTFTNSPTINQSTTANPAPESTSILEDKQREAKAHPAASTPYCPGAYTFAGPQPGSQFSSDPTRGWW